MTEFPQSPLISAQTLQDLLAGEHAPVILDCSFDLADTEAGEFAWEHSHLPGARYAHLDKALSAPRSARGPVEGGRHPLPDRDTFARQLGAWGITPLTPVVAYDDQGGPFAARAWWLLRWMGHSKVAVLDGGLGAWRAVRGAMQSDAPDFTPAPPYPAAAPAMPTIDAATLQRELSRWLLIDARMPERFRGEVEPLDTVPGHIPGARNRFFKHNLAPDGRFLDLDTLRETFAAYGVAPQGIVHQCGSGVTACHNLLVMEAAGLTGSRLYAGSWSEWCADPSRPVVRGGASQSAA